MYGATEARAFPGLGAYFQPLGNTFRAHAFSFPGPNRGLGVSLLDLSLLSLKLVDTRGRVPESLWLEELKTAGFMLSGTWAWDWLFGEMPKV